MHVAQAAAALFAGAAELDANDERTWLPFGLLERRRGNWEAARACFRKGVECAPRNPYIYQVLAYGVAPPSPTLLQRVPLPWNAQLIAVPRLRHSCSSFRAILPAHSCAYIQQACSPASWYGRQLAHFIGFSIFSSSGSSSLAACGAMQAWAVLEKMAGDNAAARDIFMQGNGSCPKWVPLPC